MILPIRIPAQPVPAIQSYDYVDVAQGVGITSFFAAIANSYGTGVLLPTAEVTLSGSTKQTNAGIQSITFDSFSFNLPRTVQGSGFFSFGWGKQVGTATGSILYHLMKFDGTTETSLMTSGTWNILAANTNSGTVLMKYSIDSPTTIKVGENLRLRVWVSCNTGGGDYIAVGHDPKNNETPDMFPSTDTDNTTIMRLGVPFRIEV